MKFVFMSYSVVVSRFVLLFVVYLVLFNMDCLLSLEVSLCSGCDECFL